MRLASEVLVPAFELLPLEGLTVDSTSKIVAKLPFSLESIDSEELVVDDPWDDCISGLVAVLLLCFSNFVVVVASKDVGSGLLLGSI